MRHGARLLAGWLYRRGENLVVVMIGVMFAAFLLQVIFRYLLQWPTGWSNELTVVLWIWVVLFGAAFVVREEEEIRFDLIYGAVRPRVRRVMTVIAAAALLVLYGGSLPAVYDYVTFMKVQKTAYLKIRFDWLFSIYVIFVVAVLARYLWLGWHALTGREPDETDPAKASPTT
ncbi:TRAP-type C4-dicarboxylate transport system permease small subunit [Chelatococcus caeni]|uniref:TRAP transporter small permease protein n=1 Tax=Chelatococcus caeni TaxID=1348468 RepID=A0A840C7R5_9HYPH|nr:MULTISPECIES: TRAP transporter small permease subunit [Chelatococcus]ALA20343.1 C4-dicarboxylate ABC transporter permease [Chelatococcus sp. CO-6]MBB4018367.1 TRAP-type C4-dicarboxylate transport system permease small subunit [Chelatococcus caeni]